MGKKFNRDLSHRLHQQIDAQPNHCFSNAVKALTLIPKAEYIQGYIVSPSMTEPYHHAWLESDRCIIDPSLPDGLQEYFPAGRRTQIEYSKFVQEVGESKNRTPIILTEEQKQNLPEHVQNNILNPNCHNILVRKMILDTKSPEFDQAYKQASLYKENRS